MNKRSVKKKPYLIKIVRNGGFSRHSFRNFVRPSLSSLSLSTLSLALAFPLSFLSSPFPLLLTVVDISFPPTNGDILVKTYRKGGFPLVTPMEFLSIRPFQPRERDSSFFFLSHLPPTSSSFSSLLPPSFVARWWSIRRFPPLLAVYY